MNIFSSLWISHDQVCHEIASHAIQTYYILYSGFSSDGINQTGYI